MHVRWGLKGLLGDILHRHPHAMSRTNSLKGSITSRISQDLSVYIYTRPHERFGSLIDFWKIWNKIWVHTISPWSSKVRFSWDSLSGYPTSERTKLGQILSESPEIAKALTFPPWIIQKLLILVNPKKFARPILHTSGILYVPYRDQSEYNAYDLYQA